MWKLNQAKSADPIIELMNKFDADSRTDKINLGIGVYQNEQGETPIFSSVRAAESQLAVEQTSKTYVGVGGDAKFVSVLGKLLFQNDYSNFFGVQAVGGSGALRLIGDFCKAVSPDSKVWISDPTWANHISIFTAAGFNCQRYAYPTHSTKNLLDGILSSLKGAGKGDFVIIHACCHNPTGLDLSSEETSQLAAFINEKGLVPVLDAAYLGFRKSFADDAADLRAWVSKFPTVLCAFSASKNFALYRERVGAVYVKGPDESLRKSWRDAMLSLARSNYSMPPDHGAAVVRMILEDPKLSNMWEKELIEAAGRLKQVRGEFAKSLTRAGCNFSTDFIESGSGLFSMLPITPAQAEKIRVDHGIYLMPSGRVNLAGLGRSTIAKVAEAVVQAIKAG